MYHFGFLFLFTINVYIRIDHFYLYSYWSFFVSVRIDHFCFCSYWSFFVSVLMDNFFHENIFCFFVDVKFPNNTSKLINWVKLAYFGLQLEQLLLFCWVELQPLIVEVNQLLQIALDIVFYDFAQVAVFIGVKVLFILLDQLSDWLKLI